MVLAELKVDNIYIVCGYTDMRKSIAGLSAIIIQQYQMRPDEHSMFLFCGKRADRMKALIWEGDGFLMLYKVLIGFRYQWPRDAKEVLIDMLSDGAVDKLDAIKRLESEGVDPVIGNEAVKALGVEAWRRYWEL